MVRLRVIGARVLLGLVRLRIIGARVLLGLVRLRVCSCGLWPFILMLLW